MTLDFVQLVNSLQSVLVPLNFQTVINIHVFIHCQVHIINRKCLETKLSFPNPAADFTIDFWDVISLSLSNLGNTGYLTWGFIKIDYKRY